MGVDAEMFVRIKSRGNWLTADDVKRLAYEIGTSFDTKTFFTMNPTQGVFKEERRALEIMQPLTDAETASDYGLEPDAVGKVVWTQDAEPIIADEDEQFIKVHLFHRYFGANYERGDWPKLRGVILWLTIRIPQGQVWYGGDSSGIEAQPATPAYLNAMDLHWALNGRRPYTRFKSDFSGIFGRMPKDDIVPPCCPLCAVPMADTGGSRDYTFFWCDGCGSKASAHVNGTVAWAGLHEDCPGFDDAGKVVPRKLDAF